MIDNTMTVVGNLTTIQAVINLDRDRSANFTIASSPRVFDKDAGEWRDGETLFLRCTVWQQSAENLVDNLARGVRVVVSGRLRQRSFERPVRATNAPMLSCGSTRSRPRCSPQCRSQDHSKRRRRVRHHRGSSVLKSQLTPGPVSWHSAVLHSQG